MRKLIPFILTALLTTVLLTNCSESSSETKKEENKENGLHFNGTSYVNTSAYHVKRGKIRSDTNILYKHEIGLGYENPGNKNQIALSVMLVGADSSRLTEGVYPLLAGSSETKPTVGDINAIMAYKELDPNNISITSLEDFAKLFLNFTSGRVIVKRYGEEHSIDVLFTTIENKEYILYHKGKLEVLNTDNFGFELY